MLIEKILNADWSEIGKRCGFTRVHVTRIARGQNHTTLDGAAKLAGALGVTLDQLYEHVTASRAARATVAARTGQSKVAPKVAPKVKTAPPRKIGGADVVMAGKKKVAPPMKKKAAVKAKKKLPVSTKATAKKVAATKSKSKVKGKSRALSLSS